MADEGYTRANVATEKSKAVNLDSYVFDLGEHPVPDSNKTKFRDIYSASGAEYSGHNFKTKIDGKEHTITIPNRVAREVHISAETERHPITFNQKLQPNYITGNRTKGPSYVGRLKVQSICYFNGTFSVKRSGRFKKKYSAATCNSKMLESLETLLSWTLTIVSTFSSI